MNLSPLPSNSMNMSTNIRDAWKNPELFSISNMAAESYKFDDCHPRCLDDVSGARAHHALTGTSVAIPMEYHMNSMRL